VRKKKSAEGASAIEMKLQVIGGIDLRGTIIIEPDGTFSGKVDSGEELHKYLFILAGENLTSGMVMYPDIPPAEPACRIAS
jgi:hypothetical protein